MDEEFGGFIKIISENILASVQKDMAVLRIAAGCQFFKLLNNLFSLRIISDKDTFYTYACVHGYLL